MVWKADAPQGNESGKVKWDIVPYTRGRGIDLGCGLYKTFPHFIGVDNGADEALFGHPIRPDIKVKTCEDLGLFASQSLDFIFSSHLLEHVEWEKVPATLKEWMRVIKVGGHLVLYLPDEDQYPKVGEPDANPDHKWNVSYERVVEAMRKAGGWSLVEFQKRDQGFEYSLYFVFRKVGNGQHFEWKRDRPKKSAGVVRYGAFGDLMQASSVFAGLKAQGFHVTLYTSPPGSDVITHDPNVDEIVLQDKDQVPNHELGNFWAHLKLRHDRWVNLSESVEGTFLALPGRVQHEWPAAVRHTMMDRNYLEFQHAVAGVPHQPKVRFFPTQDEEQWARKEKARMGGFVISWAMSGSSVHKTWPYLDAVVARILIDFPQAQLCFTGGEADKLLEAGWEKEKRVHRRAGQWSIRQSLAFVRHADVVIGPETGVLNAVACEPMAKVVFLSHSTDENLTRDWVNTHVLFSEATTCPGRGANEATACHQLHYGWQHCKRAAATSTAQCMEDITADQAYRVIWHAIQSCLEKAA